MTGSLQEILEQLNQPIQSLEQNQYHAELCLQALQLINKDKQATLWAGIQNELAVCLEQSGEGYQAVNLDRAISHLNHALDVYTQIDYPIPWAEVQANLASVYFKRIKGVRAENLELAIEHYDNALKVYTPQTNAEDWAATQNNLANAYLHRILGQRAVNLDKAIAYFESALEVFTRDVYAQQWAMIHNNLATAYSERINGSLADNLEKAIGHFELALEILTEHSYQQQWALIQHNLAIAYSERIFGVRAENLEQAILHFKQALHVRTREDFPEQWAATQAELASVYRERILGRRTENLEQAIELYAQVFEIYHRDEFPEKWATMHHNLANVFRERLAGERSDNIERAIEHFDCALEIFTRQGYPDDWAMLQDNLATAYCERLRGERANNLEQAISHYHEALKVRTRGANPRNWAQTQNNLAIAYSEHVFPDASENMEHAIKHYTQALEVYNRRNYPELWAMIQSNLASAYANRFVGERTRNLEDAIKYNGLALEEYTKSSYPEQWASVENNLATIYCDRIYGARSDNVALAIDYYKKALEVRTLTQYPSAFQQTQRNLGELYFREAQWAEAISSGRNAIHAEKLLLASAYTDVGKQTELFQTSGVYLKVSYALLKLGKVDEALMQLDQGKIRLLSRALALNEVDLSFLPADQRDLLHCLRQTIRELEAEMRLPTDTPARRDNRTLADLLEQSRSKLNDAIETIRENHPRFLPAKLSLEEMLASIPADTVMVAPIITSQGSAIFIVPGESQVVGMDQILWIDDFKEHDLTTILRGDNSHLQWGGWLGAYFDAIQSQETQAWQDTIDDTLKVLGKKLFAPILERLKQLDAQHIALLPHGGLGLFPLHAANQDIDGKQRFLIDDYSVTYAPSIYALSISQERLGDEQRQTRSLLAVVNPTGDLPYAEAEVKQIVKALGDKYASILPGKKASRHLLTNARAAYLHFACHGFYRWDDPMQSGLVLADGASLTMSQIIGQWNLRSTRLVTLSACETGITDVRQSPDEYLGLPASFLQAGAPAIIATLWSVNDLSTMLLIEKFYCYHLLDGMEIPHALRKSQIWLRDVTAGELALRFAEEEEALLAAESSLSIESVSENFVRFSSMDAIQRPFSHPYYWAAFSFTGA